MTVGKFYVHVSQQKQIDDTGNGAIKEKDAVEEVDLPKLGTKVEIYESTQDTSFYCSIIYDNTTISIVSDMDLQSYVSMLMGVEYH